MAVAAVGECGVGGALAGAAIGAGTSGLIGNRVARPHHCRHWGFDRNGDRVCEATVVEYAMLNACRP